MGGGRLWKVVAYERWLLMGGGRLWEVVAYERWSLMGGGRLWEVVAYERWWLMRWSLMRGGRLWEVVTYERWSLMRGGRLWEVVAYDRWSLMRGGRLREVVAYGRWSLMRGGRTWRFNCTKEWSYEWELYLALLTTMLFLQHRVPFTLNPVCVKIEITTTLHFSVKDKTCQHTPFSFTVRLISSSRMRVIFIFCGSSPGYLQNLKEIVLCDSTRMSTKSEAYNEMNRDVSWGWNHLRSL